MLLRKFEKFEKFGRRLKRLKAVEVCECPPREQSLGWGLRPVSCGGGHSSCCCHCVNAGPAGNWQGGRVCMRVHAGVEWRLRVGCRKSCLCCDRCGEARKAAVVTTCVRQGMCLQQVACVQQETCTRWGDVRAAGDELVSWGERGRRELACGK